jgi:hypothetical protein
LYSQFPWSIDTKIFVTAAAPVEIEASAMDIPVNCLQALPDDQEIREATAYGRVRQRADGIAEAECQVVFARREGFLGDLIGPFSGDVVIPWIGVGTIPAVKIGSLWRGRERIRVRPFPDRIDIDRFSPAEKNPIPLDETTSLDGTDGKPPIDAYPVGPHGSMPVFWLWGEGRRTGIVPVAEVIRYFFGPTTDFIKLAYHGYYQNHILGSRRLFEPKKSGFLEEAPDVLRIHAYRQLSPQEIGAAARISAAPEVFRSFLGVYRHLQAVGFGRYETYPLTSFPLLGTHRWKFYSRWIAVSDADGKIRRKRLITRIIQIEDDLPITKVIVAAPVPDLPTHEDDAEKPHGKQVRYVPTKRLTIKSRAEGSLRQREVFADDGEDAGPPPYEVERLGRVEGNGPPLPPQVDIEDIEAEFGSTADPGSTSDRVVPVSFGDRRDDEPLDGEAEPRPVPDRFGHLIAVLEFLMDHQGFEMEIISDGGDPARDRLWRFPTDDGQRTITWSYLSPPSPVVRRVLVARLRRGARQIYLLESEMRHGSDFLAIGLIRVPAQRSLSAIAIYDILEAAAKKRGVWTRLDLAFGVEKQVHRDWTVERFGEILASKFDGLEDVLDTQFDAAAG